MHRPDTDRRARPRWWWYLPAAVLIATAGRQIVLARTAHLTPWSGGGFGMFATTDGGRFLPRAHVVQARRHVRRS